MTKSKATALLLCLVLTLYSCFGCTNFTNSHKPDVPSVDSYTDEAYTVINDNEPYFDSQDYTTKSFEKYSKLDSLGRCQVAYACIGKDLMPTEERGYIGNVKPSGWQIAKYDCVDGKYLYNRCHLIGYQLTGENANEFNLITGTRYMNVEGMLPFENLTADYIKETGNHVLYRVTPVFTDNNLVADGVIIEAKSVEDKGEGVCFNVFCYNIQPGIEIDYSDGSSKDTGPENTEKNSETSSKTNNSSGSYILNTNTKKIHLPTCKYAKSISSHNKDAYQGDIDLLIKQGYEGCRACNP